MPNAQSLRDAQKLREPPSGCRVLIDLRILHRRRHIAEGEDDNFAVRDPRELQALLPSVTGMLTTLLAVSQPCR